jgi:hypothetical protein
LGPSDLYKLVKEIGKGVQNLQNFATEATATIENNLEGQLQVEEIRKAQRELNDAFNFRRSINVDSDTDAFEVNAKSERAGVKEGEEPVPAAAEAAAAASTAIPEAAPEVAKKKIRRRRRKKVEEVVEEEEPVFNLEDTQQPLANNVPDLEMSEAAGKAMKAMDEANEQLRKEMEEEEAAQRRKDRIERLQGGDTSSSSSSSSSSSEDSMAANEMAMDSGYDAAAFSPSDEQNRFQAQMSGSWNENVVSKEEELAPLAKLMEKLALLEEEKNANDARLQEEFRLREENEERFYKEKRKLLESTAAKIQADAYAGNSTPSVNSTSTATATK